MQEARRGSKEASVSLGKHAHLQESKAREQGSERMSGKAGPLAGSKAREQGRRKAAGEQANGRHRVVPARSERIRKKRGEEGERKEARKAGLGEEKRAYRQQGEKMVIDVKTADIIQQASTTP